MNTLSMIEVSPRLRFWAPSEKELRWQYEEIFQQGCYDDIRVPENAYVLDVGANIGLFSYFVKAAHPTARILAFEPMPEAARALRENIALHRLTGIEVHEFALGAVPEEKVDFTYYPVLPGNSTRYPEQKELQKSVLARSEPLADVEHQHAGYRVTVPVERLSAQLSADRAIDLLKVDVEGAELEVLLGISPEHWWLIDQVVLEVQDLDGRLAATCDLLRTHGLRPEVRPSPMIPEDILTFMVKAVR